MPPKGKAASTPSPFLRFDEKIQALTGRVHTLEQQMAGRDPENAQVVYENCLRVEAACRNHVNDTVAMLDERGRAVNVAMEKLTDRSERLHREWHQTTQEMRDRTDELEEKLVQTALKIEEIQNMHPEIKAETDNCIREVRCTQDTIAKQEACIRQLIDTIAAWDEKAEELAAVRQQPSKPMVVHSTDHEPAVQNLLGVSAPVGSRDLIPSPIHNVQDFRGPLPDAVFTRKQEWLMRRSQSEGDLHRVVRAGQSLARQRSSSRSVPRAAKEHH